MLFPESQVRVWLYARPTDLWKSFDGLSMLENRRPPPECIHHSDSGSQFASAAYRALLTEWGLKGSMSRRGNPYDNAQCESFMKTVKCE